jgi:predicted nucleic acid-binding protein
MQVPAANQVQNLVAELMELIREERARIIGAIRQELLSGIKTQSQYDALRSSLEPFPDEPLDRTDYEDAAKATNDCRAKGIAVAPTNALICSVSSKRGWSVFATDPDFANCAKILPIKLHSARG